MQRQTQQADQLIRQQAQQADQQIRQQALQADQRVQQQAQQADQQIKQQAQKLLTQQAQVPVVKESASRSIAPPSMKPEMSDAASAQGQSATPAIFVQARQTQQPSLTNQTANSTPMVAPNVSASVTTSCGSNSGLTAVLQIYELGQALSNGISFNAACEAHDKCYGTRDPKLTKAYCDDMFARIATETCNGAVVSKRACLDQKDLFLTAIRKYGENSYCEARGTCAKK